MLATIACKQAPTRQITSIVMSDSLRDQLLKAGFAQPRADKPRVPGPRGGKQDQRARSARQIKEKPRAPSKQGREDMDLARAYAVRARTDKAERERAAREAEQQAQARRERKRLLHELLDGKSLNLAEAEHARHFEHAGKIRRIHVSAEQLARLNAGELGVVVHAGRFVLVPREIAVRAQAIASDVVALLVDPDAHHEDDDGVPGDLMW